MTIGMNDELAGDSLHQVENPITKVTRVITRDDGSEVRIVATAFFGAGLHRSVDVYVHRRPHPGAEWELCSSTPHPEWRTMSVADYIERGRSPMLRAVTHGEIFKTAGMLGKPIAA